MLVIFFVKPSGQIVHMRLVAQLPELSRREHCPAKQRPFMTPSSAHPGTNQAEHRKRGNDAEHPDADRYVVHSAKTRIDTSGYWRRARETLAIPHQLAK